MLDGKNKKQNTIIISGILGEVLVSAGVAFLLKDHDTYTPIYQSGLDWFISITAVVVVAFTTIMMFYRLNKGSSSTAIQAAVLGLVCVGFGLVMMLLLRVLFLQIDM